MATTPVTLDPDNNDSSVQALRTAFDRASLPEVMAIDRGGTVQLRVPVSRRDLVDWAPAKRRLTFSAPQHRRVVVVTKGFNVDSRQQGGFIDYFFRRIVKKPQQRSSIIREAFFQRAMRAVSQLRTLDEATLAQAVQASTDQGVLLSALGAEEALATVRSQDQLAAARLRGIEAKRNLIEAEGGALSTAEVASKLRLTRQAVDKRRRDGKLIAVQIGRKGFLYPAWQLDLPHLEAVLKAIGERDSWEKVSFFLNSSAPLANRTPLAALRSGKPALPTVLRAAASCADHGA